MDAGGRSQRSFWSADPYRTALPYSRSPAPGPNAVPSTASLVGRVRRRLPLERGRSAYPLPRFDRSHLGDDPDSHIRLGDAFMAGLIWGIIVILFIFWVLGFAIHIGGGLIHILLVIALVLLVFNILTGRGARV